MKQKNQNQEQTITLSSVIIQIVTPHISVMPLYTEGIIPPCLNDV
jgi:hypothetical protein